MTEADMTVRFSHWAKANAATLPSFAFEAKLCDLRRKKSVGLSDFEEHQLPCLRSVASEAGTYYKIPDLGSRNPFDGFLIKGEGWVVIFWYFPRKTSLCTVIRIQDFDACLAASGKKSVTMAEAERIAAHRFTI